MADSATSALLLQFHSIPKKTVKYIIKHAQKKSPRYYLFHLIRPFRKLFERFYVNQWFGNACNVFLLFLFKEQ